MSLLNDCYSVPLEEDSLRLNVFPLLSGIDVAVCSLGAREISRGPWDSMVKPDLSNHIL